MKTFKDIKIGEVFDHNGTEWLKRSTRTAKVHYGKAYMKTQPTYYFSKDEQLYPYIRVEDTYYGA